MVFVLQKPPGASHSSPRLHPVPPRRLPAALELCGASPTSGPGDVGVPKKVKQRATDWAVSEAQFQWNALSR